MAGAAAVWPQGGPIAPAGTPVQSVPLQVAVHRREAPHRGDVRAELLEQPQRRGEWRASGGRLAHRPSRRVQNPLCRSRKNPNRAVEKPLHYRPSLPNLGRLRLLHRGRRYSNRRRHRPNYWRGNWVPGRPNRRCRLRRRKSRDRHRSCPWSRRLTALERAEQAERRPPLFRSWHSYGHRTVRTP